MRKKILLSATVILAQLSACDSHNSLLSSQPEENPHKAIEASMDIQNEASQINEKIIGALAGDTRSGEYPDYYGGSYLTRNGELVVLICGDMNNGTEKIRSISDSPIVIYRQAQYSYQSLDDLMDILNEKIILPENKSIFSNVAWYGLMTEDNRIMVALKDCSEAAISTFKKSISDSPMITFKPGTPVENQSSDLGPGGRASLSTTSNRYGTYAFRAREKSGNKREGMVTAGHVAPLNTDIYFSGALIGKSVKSINKGSVDGAFIIINNTAQYPLTNDISGMAFSSLSTETSLPRVGDLVNLRGASSGSTSGYIVSTNATFTVEETLTTFTNMTAAGYSAQEGDSGGIIYTYIEAEDIRYTVGVHKGANKEYSFFSKANLVLNELGLERY